MRKIVLCLLTSLLSSNYLLSQPVPDSNLLLLLNSRMDQLVIERNVLALDSLYADDFVFRHGSGKVEGKTGWFKTVKAANYLLRQHDSVKVELHPEFVILKGRMNMEKQGKERLDRYHLRYLRVFIRRSNRWYWPPITLLLKNTNENWLEAKINGVRSL